MGGGGAAQRIRVGRAVGGQAERASAESAIAGRDGAKAGVLLAPAQPAATRYRLSIVPLPPGHQLKYRAQRRGPMRTGIWLVGARGSGGRTTVVGAAAGRAGLAPPPRRRGGRGAPPPPWP